MNWHAQLFGLCLLAGGLVQSAWAIDKAPTPRDPETVVATGTQMEQKHQWTDAIDLYKSALKKWPTNANLTYALRRSQFQFAIERRYDDLSFRESLRKLPAENGIQLFNSVLEMIQTHYVDVLDTTSIVAHGTESLWLALGNERFLDNNLFGADPERLRLLRKDLRARYWNKPVRGQYEANNLIREICQLSMDRVGLEPGAVVMEYVFGACNCCDDYSNVMTPGRLRDLFNNIDGQFVGVGIVMEADLGKGMKLRQVLPESPAAESGLKAGDLLVGIDKHDCRVMSTDEAANLVTGQPGSKITLIVERPGVGRVEAHCTRREVTVRSIPLAKIIDSSAGIGYIQLTGFQKSTVTEMDNALKNLKAQGMKSLVLDVRQNPGGLLTTAVDLLDRFIADGVLVSTRGREPSQNQTHTAHAPGTWNIPIVLLIDENSASASEIVAGAFRDHRRAKLVGRNSFGKWSVQSIYDHDLGYGCGIRMTTAKFYSPNGDTLGKIGVKPDIEIPSDQAVAYVIGQVDPVGDPDVRTAVDQLKQVEFTQR
jgi:carboxyl-terminal processing protease